MRFFFHPEAIREFSEAVDYYEDCEKGLGVEFVKEVYKGIELISQYPEAWHRLSKHVRRFLLSRFPYGVTRISLLDPYPYALRMGGEFGRIHALNGRYSG